MDTSGVILRESRGAENYVVHYHYDYPFREISREIRVYSDLAFPPPKFKPGVGRAREEHRTGP